MIGEGTVTVGRMGLAAEYLLQYKDVGRRHLNITIRRSGIGAMLEDTSQFHTYVNGVCLQKNAPVFINNGSMIRLATRATLTYKIEEVTVL